LKEIVVTYAMYPPLLAGLLKKIKLSTACVPAEIRTENIPSASLQRYHDTALLAKMCIFGYLTI
jgi:hypothetical protein